MAELNTTSHRSALKIRGKGNARKFLKKLKSNLIPLAGTDTSLVVDLKNAMIPRLKPYKIPCIQQQQSVGRSRKAMAWALLQRLVLPLWEV